MTVPFLTVPHRTALLGLLVGTLALLAGGMLSGCDQGGGIDTETNVITPSSSRIGFEVRPGTADTTQQLTLTYTDLSTRPTPVEVPEPFTVEQVEMTGSASDGTSVFNVTFSPPNEIVTFRERVLFEAGGEYVTIQFFGDVGFNDILITGYGSEGIVNGVGEGIFGFNGIGASTVEGQLSLVGENTGGPNNFPGVVHVLNETVDFGETPVLVARMQVTSDSETPAIVRAALNQDGDGPLPDANTTAAPVVKEVPADGEYREYYFDFRDLFVQFDGQPVDPTNINEVVFLVNDGGSLGFLGTSQTFTGTILIERLARRPDIPGEEDDGGGDDGGGDTNEDPSARFTVSPESPQVNETVAFTDASTDDGTITARDWDFGDGTTDSGETVSHSYASAGDYTVTLTVTDDEDATDTSTQTITVTDPNDTSGDFRGDDDGDGRIVFDDFEDGTQEGEYFTFSDTGGRTGLAESNDVPMGSDGSTALAATIEGGEGGGFAGYGKGTGSEIEVQGLDLSDLGSDPYLTMYIRSNATLPYTLEINLQEDQDGNGTFDGSGAVDDEFQYNYAVSPDASGYTRISVPISAFEDDNAVNSGGDGELSSRIANLIFAIGGLPGETFTFTVDDIIYSNTDLSDAADNSSASACENQGGYQLFFEDNFDSFNEAFWDKGVATFNGNLSRFREDNITFRDGKMVFTLEEEFNTGPGGGPRDYAGAELRTDNQDGFYSYGCYEVRMKSAGPSGTVSSFFAYRFNPWQEIDIEIVGKNNNSMLTNIYFNDGEVGDTNNDPFQTPPFPRAVGHTYDASQEFHTYAFEWLPGEIKWYRDGQLVKQATVDGADSGQIPDLQMQIMMNLWLSDAPSFAGEIDDSDFPVQSEYDWVRFYEPVN